MSYWPNTATTNAPSLASKTLQAFSTRLGRKLVVQILLVNALLSLLASSVQLYAGYSRDRDQVSEAVSTIEDGFSTGLADALWEYNFPLVEALLEGIYSKRDVHFVNLVANQGREWSLGELDASVEFENSLDFIYRTADGTQQIVGTLRVGMTYVHIQQRVLSQIWVLLISNFAKTACASMMMLVLFERRVSRHLTCIAQHVRSISWQRNNGLISLDRKDSSDQDDLDYIVSAVNSAKTRARQDLLTLQKEVDRRRATEIRLREQTEVLLQANRQQAEFSYAISHDLKSPANTLTMLLDDIWHEGGDRLTSVGKEMLDDATKTVTRMTLLVEDILGYARTIDGEMSLEPVDMGELVADVLLDLKADVATANADFVIRSLPTVVGHPVQLRMLTQNLLSNALKFRAPERPLKVTVEASIDNDLFSIRVRDNGIGIPVQYRSRVFGLFQRLHSHAAYPGSGIGLSLCHRIVVNHAGRISIHETPGGGSTFEVQLPRVQNAK